jgi:hypothetical protein
MLAVMAGAETKKREDEGLTSPECVSKIGRFPQRRSMPQRGAAIRFFEN